MKSKYIPNIITAVRILGTLFLLWAKLPSLYFFVIYSICGFSDVLDGWLARKTKTTSEFGARLDSVEVVLWGHADKADAGIGEGDAICFLDCS